MSDFSDQANTPPIPTKVQLVDLIPTKNKPVPGAELHGSTYPDSPNSTTFKVPTGTIKDVIVPHKTGGLGDHVQLASTNTSVCCLSSDKGVTLLTHASVANPAMPMAGLEISLPKRVASLLADVAGETFELKLDALGSTGKFIAGDANLTVPLSPLVKLEPLDSLPVPVGAEISAPDFAKALPLVAAFGKGVGEAAGIVADGSTITGYSHSAILQHVYPIGLEKEVRFESNSIPALASGLRAMGGTVTMYETERGYAFVGAHAVLASPRSRNTSNPFRAPLATPPSLVATVARERLQLIVEPFALRAGKNDVAQISVVTRGEVADITVYHYHRLPNGRELISTKTISGGRVKSAAEGVEYAAAHVHLRQLMAALRRTEDEQVSIEFVDVGTQYIRLRFQTYGRPTTVVLGARNPGVAQGVSKARRR